jgi:hypothetical protein
MAGLVDRYTPADPYPRSLAALVASSVPLTLFLFGTVVTVNMYRTAEVLQGTAGLVLATLFVVTLLSTHVAHVLVRDVAARANGDARASDTAGSATVRSGTDDAGRATDAGQGVAPSADPLSTLQRRYAAGELDDDEFEQRLETLQATTPDRTDAGTDRLVE